MMSNSYFNGMIRDPYGLDYALTVPRRDVEGKSGLEVTLVIIDRLLRPEIPDNSALEVGGLAAEVVDKVLAFHVVLESTY